MKAFAYLRVSSKDQIKGTSLDKQREICQIIGRNLAIPDTDLYEEPGISGENIKNRPALCSLLERIKQGDYDNGIGIAFDQDRLTRRTGDWAQISTLLKEHGIILHTSQGILDFGKRDQRLTANIKGSLSEWHLDYIREQTRDGRRRRLLEGKWQGGLILWGYRFNPGLPKGERLEIDPEKAKLVRTLLIKLSPLPLCEIANEMNHRNIPSPKGGLWNSNKIAAFFEEKRLLKYSGFIRVFYQPNGNGEWKHIPEGIIVKAKWSPIITERERDKLLRRTENWRRHRTYPTKANKLLTGLGIAFCGHCGASVATTSMHRNRNGSLRAYYGCTNRSCIQKPKLRMEMMDDLIQDSLKNIRARDVFEGYNYFMRIQKKRAVTETLKDLEGRMSQIISRKNKLIEKVSLGLLQDPEINPVMEALRRDMAILEEQKQKLISENKDKFLPLSDFKRLKKGLAQFKNLPLDQKRLGLKALVGKVTLFKDRCEIDFNFPVSSKAETKLTHSILS